MSGHPLLARLASLLFLGRVCHFPGKYPTLAKVFHDAAKALRNLH